MKPTFNLTKLVRPSVLSLAPYSSARDEYVSDGSKMVFLDANENPYQTNVNRYPDPYQRKLKSIIGDVKGLPPENLLLGNGSDEVLDLLFRAFCVPEKDNIITLPPTYGMYKVLAGINTVENKEVVLSADFQPRIDKILDSQNSNSKILFICSPNNPTGNIIKPEIIEELLNGFNGIVVVDEAYIDFSKETSWAQKLDQFPNLVVTQTLSKAYGMAGIRIGLCWASKEIISILNTIKPPYNVNELSQQKAFERLSNFKSVLEEINSIAVQKKFLEQELLKICFVDKIYASEANFLLVKVDDSLKRYNQLLQLGIVVRNRGNQVLCVNTLRFTIGTEAENIKLITALNQLQKDTN